MINIKELKEIQTLHDIFSKHELTSIKLSQEFAITFCKNCYALSQDGASNLISFLDENPLNINALNKLFPIPFTFLYIINNNALKYLPHSLFFPFRNIPLSYFAIDDKNKYITLFINEKYKTLFLKIFNKDPLAKYIPCIPPSHIRWNSSNYELPEFLSPHAPSPFIPKQKLFIAKILAKLISFIKKFSREN